MAAWSNCRLVSSGVGVWRAIPLSPLLRVSRILFQFNWQEVPQGRHPTCSSRLSHAVVAGGIQARHGRQKRLSCWVESRPRCTHYVIVKLFFDDLLLNSSRFLCIKIFFIKIKYFLTRKRKEFSAKPVHFRNVGIKSLI